MLICEVQWEGATEQPVTNKWYKIFPGNRAMQKHMLSIRGSREHAPAQPLHSATGHALYQASLPQQRGHFRPARPAASAPPQPPPALVDCRQQQLLFFAGVVAANSDASIPPPSRSSWSVCVGATPSPQRKVPQPLLSIGGQYAAIFQPFRFDATACNHHLRHGRFDTFAKPKAPCILADAKSER